MSFYVAHLAQSKHTHVPGPAITIYYTPHQYLLKTSSISFINLTNILGRGKEQGEKYRDEARDCQD